MALRHRLFAVLLLPLAGCVTPVDTTKLAVMPGRPIDRDTALTIVHQAQRDLAMRIRDADRFQATTKTVVGLGMAGAASAVVFKAPSNVILGFLTASGLGYAANTQSNPKPMIDALTAGRTNLRCIETAGLAGESSRDTLTGQMQSLVNALARVRAAQQTVAADARALQGQADAAKRAKAQAAAIAALQIKADLRTAAVSRAEGALNVAEGRRDQINAFLAIYDPIPTAMIAATNDTMDEVNRQIRTNTPDVDRILAMGSQVQSVINSGGVLRSSLEAAANGIRTAGQAHGANFDQNLANLDQATNDLGAVLKLIANPPSTQPSAAAIANCHIQFAEQAPITLSFNTPVTLQQGASIRMALSNANDFLPHWKDAIPTDLTWQMDPIQHVMTVTAPANAKIASYTLSLWDYGTYKSPDFTLNVTAAPAAAPPAAKPAAPTLPAAPAAPATAASGAAGGGTAGGGANGGAQPPDPPH